MKITFILFLMFFSNNLFAQYYSYGNYNFYIGFDGADYLHDNFNQPPSYRKVYDSLYVKIDTTKKHNKWQIGHPAKTNFTSGFNSPNAIVTDTSLPCNTGDTSIFTLTITKNQDFVDFSFIYKLDIDSGDVVLIEHSADTGKTWANFLSDSVFKFYTAKPDLTISTVWDSVLVMAVQGNNYYNNTGYHIFRFTFIAGQSGKIRDGFMIDNIRFGYAYEGLAEINKTLAASVSPNPANTSLTIKYSLPSKDDLSISITNVLGQTVKEIQTTKTQTGQVDIPTSTLPSGVYFYNLKTATAQSSGKIVVQH
jgi:hypothetical protein